MQSREEVGVDVYTSAIEAYGKAYDGFKALQVYEHITKVQEYHSGMVLIKVITFFQDCGLQGVPLRAHTSMMSYYIENGETRKAIEIFDAIDNAKVPLDDKILTCMLFYLLFVAFHHNSFTLQT